MWKTDQDFYYDLNEMVRVQITDEEFHDQTPKGPQEGGDETDEAELTRISPYTLTGSMRDGGLGCALWWDARIEEEE